MLDIKFIRENKDIVKDAARKKHIDVDIDKLLELDNKRLKLLQEVEEYRAKQNKASEEISNEKNDELRQKKINEMKDLKANLTEKENELKKVLEEWRSIMLHVPNIPDVSVPEGVDEKQNVEIRSFGDIPNFSFTPKNHIELLKDLDLVDFERGSKVHGFRGYFLKKEGALLSWALWNYTQEFFLKKNFVPFIAPSIVRKEFFYGTGHLPNDAEDLYVTQDGDYLSGTAEVPMMAFHANEVLDIKNLPIKYLAFSPCYRREAGSYGKDTKGLVRVHEFFKLEQVLLCEASHEESVKLHEEITNNAEELMQSLEIPYRVVINCGGDLGLGQVKKYDIEAWVPSENKYRETHSSSYFHDFQTRRFNIKYKDENNKLHFAHSLNNTAIATPRIFVSIVENFQNSDGTIKIPKVLQKYFGKETIG